MTAEVSAFQDSKFIYSHTPIEKALYQVQIALRDLKEDPRIQEAGIAFKNVELNFVTATKVTAEGEVKVWVVTAGGSVGFQSTSTLKAVLTDPPARIADRKLFEDPLAADSIKALVGQIAEIVLMGSKPPYALALESGEVTIELVVSAEGNLQAANEDVISKILKFFGLLEFSLKVSGELIKTSSIKVSYKKA